LNGKIKQITQSTIGNLLTRDITKEIETSKMMPMEYNGMKSRFLTAIYVVVPALQVSDWNKTYEDLSDFVVPGSSELLCAESDFSLFKVVLFKHVVDDFKVKAKEKRFVVRKYEPTNTTSAAEIGKMQQKYENLRANLIRWCTTNFGEAYFLWVHLKAIQCYVESILRFGLPADFEVVLIQPKREKDSQLEKALSVKYAHLEKAYAHGSEDDEEGIHYHHEQDKYYPYVFLEIPVSFF